MKIKFKAKMEEAAAADNIANNYQKAGPDYRDNPEIDNKIGEQLPTYKMNNQFAGEPGKQSSMQTSTLASPQTLKVEEEYELDEDLLFESELNEQLLYEKKDRCYYQAKQKFDVFPSAYASGYIVRCRRGQIGRKRKKKVKINEEWSEEYKDSIDCDNPKGFSQRAHCQGREKNEELVLELDEEILQEGTFDKEKSQGLHGWFARKGGKGGRGWVDCNTCRTNPKTGRKTCKTCGRQSGEQRSKYPACRPTPSACNRRGTSKKRGPMRVSWKPKKKTNEGEES